MMLGRAQRLVLAVLAAGPEHLVTSEIAHDLTKAGTPIGDRRIRDALDTMSRPVQWPSAEPRCRPALVAGRTALVVERFRNGAERRIRRTEWAATPAGRDAARALEPA